MHVDVQQWALLPPPSRKYTVLVKFMRKYGPSIACARIRLSHTYLFVVLSPRTTSRTAHTALPSVIPPSQAVAPARSQLLPGSIAMHPEQDVIVPHRGKSYPSR